jgi:CBS domain-containing protein
VVGVLTDRDIVTAVVAKEVDAATLTVEDVMSRDVFTALGEDSITDLLKTMRRKGLRRLPVTTAQGILVGLVTVDDVLPLLAKQLRDIALTIEAEQLREQRSRP